MSANAKTNKQNQNMRHCEQPPHNTILAVAQPGISAAANIL